MRRGRLLKFTEGRQKALLTALATGMTRRASCGVAGIHHSTFYTYLEQNPTFLAAVEAAENEAEAYMIERALSGRGDVVPKEDAWKWLTKRRRNEWGERRSVDVNARVDGSFEIHWPDYVSGSDTDATS